MNPVLTKSIRQILMAGSSAVLVASAIGLAHAVGVQIPPPGPGQVPDYFGVSSNYANSPTPNFAQVTIVDPGVAGVAGGTGAVAAATTVDYASPNYGLTPIGIYSKNLMDVQLANGGSGYSANTTVTVNGYDSTGKTPVNTTVSLTPIIVGGVIAGFVEIPHGDIKDATGAIVVNGAAWPKDPTTLQWVYPAGMLLADPNNAKNVGGLIWSGLGVDPTGGVAAPNNFPSPIPGTGIRKFLNTVSLPGSFNELGQTLTIADATVYANPFVNAAGATVSDYYEIAEVAYIQQMHSDLPPTHLRGYIQLVPSTMANAVDITTLPSIQTSAPANTYYVMPGTTNASFLGPVIVAQKDRAVRIKAVNLLPINSLTAHGSELPFPVDHTYMGSGQQDATGTYVADETDTRTAVHLHGGNTPWISDGTPRQWFKPAGETGANKGISATNVPDMWYDATTGNLLPNQTHVDPLTNQTVIDWAQGSTTPPPAAGLPVGAVPTNSPGDGALTFYYTNEQSARLMFYHDHAEGITRLNVYDGLAAGYILQDPTEKAMTHGNQAAGGSNIVGAAPPYAEVLPEDVIPLVIQEKTFVPDNTNPVMTFYGPFRSQLNAQDPTWRWGSNGTSFDGVTGVFVPYGQFPGTTVVPGAAMGVTNANGPGDLWVPHVYMTNQNPGDAKGTNPQGRWDYGAWFWPPVTNIQHSQVTNPYYDKNCTSITAANNPVGTCEFQYIPGIPTGGQMPAGTNSVNCQMVQNGKGTSVKSCTPNGTPTPAELNAMSQASGSPESFNDTALVNGTVYPFMNVEPKKYRLRLLSAGNDRTLNLSLWVASSKSVDTTSGGNIGVTSPAATAATCYGGGNPTDAGLPANVAPACTEVRMVPWDASQNTVSKFPTWWYTTLKGGITFDGRPGGVPDPATRGPAMVQIATEGGFLAQPAVIKNQPINYEYNVKNILVTNVKEHALMLGAAERADVVVDFSQFAGSTIIMYNDAPAPMPAYDLRLDYFTGSFDNTDTGGAFQTVPGYGPNTRTIMQFRVASSCAAGTNCGVGINRAPLSTHPVDDVDTAWLTSLTPEVRKAFKFSQEPIVVPQAAYNSVYGTTTVDAVSQNLSAIGDTTLSFTPFAVNSGVVTSSTPVIMGLGPKAIQELFTLDYGRMNSTLGVEIPNTTAATQTTIPMGYVEPPTELVQITKDLGVATAPIGQLADGTQIWKITHNGVDSHPIHFHLFSVQLINRVGWDGAIYPPDANEVGWKEVVRMHPLSDVIVALRPKTLNVPFKLGNSHHLADATQPDGSKVNQPNLSPLGGGSTIVNRVLNYGWEYVWHCHILGHEENDFMRSIAVAVPPEDPTATAATPVVQATVPFTGNTISWTDNSMVSNWAMIVRATDAALTQNRATFPVAYAECLDQAGCARTYKDTTAAANTTYYYRVTSNSTVGAGDTYASLPAALDKTNILPANNANKAGAGFLGYDNVTASSQNYVQGNTVIYNPVANWSSAAAPVVTVIDATTAPVAPDFGNVAVGSTAPQMVTLYNTGTGVLSISGITTNGAPYTVTGGTCSAAVPLNPAASCTVIVSFSPTVAGVANGMLTITDNSGNVASSQTATLTGTGTTAPFTLDTTALTFNVYNDPLLPSTTSTLTPTPATQTVTVTNPSAAAAVTVAPTLTGTGFTQAAGGTCSAATPVPANGSCTYNVTYKASTTNAAVNALGKLGNTGKVTFTAGTYSTIVTLTGNAAPKAPTNLAKSAVAANSLTLKWTAPANTVASYTVQQSIDNVNWSPAVGTITGTSMAVTGLVGNTNYAFRVAANNAAGQGAFTTNVTAKTPIALTAISAVSGIVGDLLPAPAVGLNISAGLNWTAVNNANVSYQVRYANNSAMTGATTVSAVSGQQITVGGIKRVVYLQVRTVAGGVNGAWSPVSALAALAQ